MSMRQVLAIKLNLSDQLANSYAVDRLGIDVFSTRLASGGENNDFRAGLKESLIFPQQQCLFETGVFCNLSLGVAKTTTVAAAP